MHHGVGGDRFCKPTFLFQIGKFTVDQKISDFHEITVLGKLLNGVTAVIEQSLVAINIGNGGAARRRGEEARVISENPVLSQCANINNVLSQAAGSTGSSMGALPLSNVSVTFVGFFIII